MQSHFPYWSVESRSLKQPPGLSNQCKVMTESKKQRERWQREREKTNTNKEWVEYALQMMETEQHIKYIKQLQAWMFVIKSHCLIIDAQLYYNWWWWMMSHSWFIENTITSSCLSNDLCSFGIIIPSANNNPTIHLMLDAAPLYLLIYGPSSGQNQLESCITLWVTLTHTLQS